MSDFEQREARLSGGTLRYYVGGEGRPVLYIHSAGGTRISAALTGLAKDFRIYQPVLPGFDGTATLDSVSSMQDLANLAAEFAEREIGESCDVIGHSFGGWVAAWLAVLHGQRVGQLVLEAPAGFRPEGVGGLGGTPEELRRRMYAHPERITTPEKAPQIQAGNRRMVERYHGAMAMDQELMARLHEITCPTLIVCGTKDGVIPPESGRLLRGRIRTSYLAFLYDAAHAIEVDQPLRFERLVREFLTRGEAFIINWGDAPAA